MKSELPLNYATGKMQEKAFICVYSLTGEEFHFWFNCFLIHSENKIPFCFKCHSKAIFLITELYIYICRSFKEEAVIQKGEKKKQTKKTRVQ